MQKNNNIEFIGCSMKFYMQRKKLSFPEVEELTGISIRTLKRYADGETMPMLDKAVIISECLGASINQIWRFER